MPDTPLAFKPRHDWIDRAKAISICLVVLAHARIELAFIGIDAAWVDAVVDLFATMRMPLFFAASGLFAGSWIRRSWAALLRGKVLLLVWVFVVWQPVVFAYKVVEMTLLPGQPENSLLDQVAKVLLSPVRPNGELWFLWALALFFLIAKATSRFPAWVQIATAGLVSFAWLSYANTLVPEGLLRLLGNGWSGLASYYVFFIAGALLSGKLIPWISRSSWWGSVGVVLVWSFLSWARLEFDVTFPGFTFLMCCISVLAGFHLARVLFFVKSLLYLGQNTLQIYVAHIAILVVLVVAVRFSPFLEFFQAWPGVAVVFSATLAIVASLVISKFLKHNRIGRLAYQPPALWARGTADVGQRG